MSRARSDSVRQLRWRSPAKVNLCLRVVGRRADGYHLLDSIFVPIDLCDHITATVAGVAAGAPTRLEVRCDHPGVPHDASNLAVRAAAAILTEAGVGAEVRLEIEKTIPPGSGLGGGSGNAAAVLRGLNAALGLGVPPARVRALALALGADVPFFLGATAARVRGIGEEVAPITGWTDLALVVAIPPVAVSTAWAFRAFAASGATRGEAVRSAKPMRDEAARLAAGATPASDLLVNDLEGVVLPAYPAIAALKEAMLASGVAAAVMSGSGSAVVGIARSRGDAEAIAAALRVHRPQANVHAVGVWTRPREVDRSGGAA